jgi:hypothetical protein
VTFCIGKARNGPGELGSGTTVSSPTAVQSDSFDLFGSILSFYTAPITDEAFIYYTAKGRFLALLDAFALLLARGEKHLYLRM